MPYENIPLGEYGDKGIWRRSIGRVLERDLPADLARDAERRHEQATRAETKTQDKARDEAEEALKRQQAHKAKVQEIFQQPAWVAERERAFAIGGEKALTAITAQHEMRAKLQIARAQDLTDWLNRPAQPKERSYDRGR